MAWKRCRGMSAAASTTSTKSVKARERPSDPAPKEFKDVFRAELESINSRRNRLRENLSDYRREDFASDIDTGPDRRMIEAVGLALSGGGIRSASFCLGVLQALNAPRCLPTQSAAPLNPQDRKDKEDAATAANRSRSATIIDRIDYLSTVSGGGYIGCSLAVGMSKQDGDFPFDSKLEEDEPKSVRHIRDHSNYLFPNGVFDFFRNATIFIRGLVTNIIIILPLILFPAALTIWLNPSVGDLDKPLFTDKFWNILEFKTFILTKYIFIILLLLFVLWALLLSIHDRSSRSPVWRTVLSAVAAAARFQRWLGGRASQLWRSAKRWIGKQAAKLRPTKPPKAKRTQRRPQSRLAQSLRAVVRGFFGLFSLVKKEGDFREALSPRTVFLACGIILLVVVAFCEAQPFLLNALIEAIRKKASLTSFVIDWFTGTAGLLVVIAVTVVILSRRIALLLRHVNSQSTWGIRLASIASVAAVYLAGAALPILIWMIYLKLCMWGIPDGGDEAPRWLIILTTAAHVDYVTELLGWFAKFALGPSLQQLDFLFGFVGLEFRLSSMLDMAFADAVEFARRTPIGSFYLYASIVVAVLACVLSPNSNSLHRLYRDRLSKAFIFYEPKATSWLMTFASRLASLIVPRMVIKPLTTTQQAELEIKAEKEDLPAQDNFKLSALSDEFAPYLLVNSAVNIQASKHANQRGRNADFFMFSPNFIGSVATHYASTMAMERYDQDVDVATAMAISGAAASANMGGGTIKALTPTLTILNVRLGYWLRNPGWVQTSSWWQEFITRLFEATNFYFFLELFGRLKEDSRHIYVTDGGHIENLGIYELLRRRCRLIIAVDAEADPNMNFASFVKLQRHARIDLGTRITLPWRAIRARTLAAKDAIEKGNEIDPLVPRKGPHCAIGLIAYPNQETGYLIYIKSSMTCDESDVLLDYKRRNPLYPHEATSDQFFTEEQFEVYRALGFHAAYRLFNAQDGDSDRVVVYSPSSDAGILTDMFANDATLNKIREILNIPTPAP